MDALQAISYIGLIASFWDLASKFRVEYEFLWTRSLFDLNATQILYIFTRYSPFPLHTANIIALHMRAKYLPLIPIHICRLWYIFTMVMGNWASALLLINLMLRVYALYNRDSRMIIALVVLLAVKFLKIPVGWIIILPSMKFTTTCIPLYVQPGGIAVFTLIELLIQGIPVYLTLIRSKSIQRTIQTTRITMLVKYLRRDGVFSWTLTTVLSAIFLIVATCARNTPNIVPQLVCPLSITILSALGCRLILRIRRPIDNQAADHPRTPEQLSVELDTYDSTWTTRSSEPELEESIPNEVEIPVNVPGD